MSVSCRCFTEFPPRNFRTLRDADTFGSLVRFSTLFLPLDRDGMSFGCRRCGTTWTFTLGDHPAATWRAVKVAARA